MSLDSSRNTDSESLSGNKSLLEEYGIKRDPRFVRASQEAKVVFGYLFANIVFFIAIAYWGGVSYDGEYTYILNMPPYFLLTVIATIVSIIFGVVIGLYYIEDDSLEAWE